MTNKKYLHTGRNTGVIGLILAVVLLARVCLASDLKEQVEEDWFKQLVRNQTPVTTQSDAEGAVDGIKDGKWGFHTGNVGEAWWQVDLGETYTLNHVLIYNRCDAPQRAVNLKILLSDDATNWREVYEHDGSIFYGFTDNKPLSVSLSDQESRYVRIQVPLAALCLHLDEVEVYGRAEPSKNLALNRPADQSSVSMWSNPSAQRRNLLPVLKEVLDRGRKLAADLERKGVEIGPFLERLNSVSAEVASLPEDATGDDVKSLFLQAHWTVRELAFSNPLLDFDRLLFAKRVPGTFSHMSDQHYGWWSRPGGGLYVLDGVKSASPNQRCLTEGKFPPGSFLRPTLSYDGRKVLFAYCRYYEQVAGSKKADKKDVPEDAFYHVYEIGVDGTGLRQLTHGKYDDFDACYLPSGDIVFLSTRRGQFIQCNAASAQSTTQADLPDSYVRCGGDNVRPVSVYTLHTMDADGKNLRAISSFESFEWTPSIMRDGRIMYARWDYVDREPMPYMSLWSTNPDGTNPQLVYGNFTLNPHCVFEAQCIPDSHKIVFTASGHHAQTMGSLVLLDIRKGQENAEPLQRITPEVCFPETEGWPKTYYANPWPLSDEYFLVSWSDQPINGQGGVNSPNALGLYLLDAFGNLELIYRDSDISSMYPLPVRPTEAPPVIPAHVAWDGPQEGCFLLQNVYQNLNVPKGAVKRLRIVGVPPKTQPDMNTPNLGVTGVEPGKFVLGTVPVEQDGSAYFKVPSGVPVFFQALDESGQALQTMRTLTQVQPSQTASCIGCHESRYVAPSVSSFPMAAKRPASKITLGPEGSLPMRFDKLVQPVLDGNCVKCHSPGGEASKFDLTPNRAYASLISLGLPSVKAYWRGRSVPEEDKSETSRLFGVLLQGKGKHDHRNLKLDSCSLERLVLWMDLYGQVQGSFSHEQEEQLVGLLQQYKELFTEHRHETPVAGIP